MSDGSRFSLVAFALALATVSLGTAGGLAFVPVVGTYVGTLAGAFGAHFGDDLRDGLTEPIGDPASGSTDISDVGVPPMTESKEETIESTEAPINESVRRRAGESAGVDDSVAVDDPSEGGELEYE